MTAGPAPQQQHLPMDLQRMIIQAQTHLTEGNPELAFPLLRQALGHRTLGHPTLGHPTLGHQTLQGRVRGDVAGLLGWTLLEHDPVDPVPQEAREALAVAVACAPTGHCTPQLQAYLLVHDGDPAAALRCAAAALSRLPDQDWGRAALLCIESAAHHDLGHDVESSRLRESAIALWPECDLLPWLERRTTG